MDLNKILERYKNTARLFISEAAKYSGQEFAQSPGADEWSLAQVYHHIATVTDQCLAYALQCAEGKAKNKPVAIGPAIFSMMGSFPPVKIKVKKIPGGVKHIYMPQNITKEQAVKGLEESIEKMEKARPAIQKASKSQRIEHWAGGWFNAAQWYHSAEMHIRHHLRQKKRIDKVLGRVNT